MRASGDREFKATTNSSCRRARAKKKCAQTGMAFYKHYTENFSGLLRVLSTFSPLPRTLDVPRGKPALVAAASLQF